MKKSTKTLMNVLSASVLLSLSSFSFAELVNHSSNPGEGSISWSSEDVSKLLENDNAYSGEAPTPQATTTVTTTIRKSNGVVTNNPPAQTVRILDTNNYSNQPSVSARAALVMDAQTGEVLYSKNTNTAMPIASLTKLMTAVVTSDAKLNMSEKITLQQGDFSCSGCKTSSSTLRAGDTMNRAEVLLFALMKSENPAASALARTYPGGRPAFFAAMNKKARELGMSATHYVESTGLHPGNVSSARDLGILVSAASQYGLIRQFSTTASYDFNLGYRVLKSNNTNALVRNGGWNINLSKTGYINEAGRCVAMHTTLNNRPAVVVLLGADSSQSRTNDAIRLMNWASQLPKRV
ncbi:D-alanyl-D-alanine carboxypeptidase family protein [Acinetobacter lanii]|uniref:D-alanyl-D-alanine endopeptidase n=1 Tax=Acinetobacter lanii TaxID=2715163 RepID=A0A6G8S7P5_9GAMM|nr:serine hydrolase [Acinetobacter lanii]QIO10078.1 D-alanyl-D-alanine endopeptidase [Acinetobacter lanii]